MPVSLQLGRVRLASPFASRWIAVGRRSENPRAVDPRWYSQLSGQSWKAIGLARVVGGNVHGYASPGRLTWQSIDPNALILQVNGGEGVSRIACDMHRAARVLWNVKN